MGDHAVIMSSTSGNSKSTHPLNAETAAAQTDWSMIRAAIRDGGEAEALERVARRYWPAIYAYVRATGADAHKAADLTQGFVCDVILDRGLLERADPEQGRFRNLLLTSLKNYLREQHRRNSRQKRAPASGIVGMSPDTMSDIVSAPGASPDWAFSCQWSAMMIGRVLERVRERCRADGMERGWQVFEDRVARPMLHGGAPTGYAELVRRLGLNDASQAANLLITIKRRVARELLVAIRETVDDPGDVQNELRELLGQLERPS